MPKATFFGNFFDQITPGNDPDDPLMVAKCFLWPILGTSLPAHFSATLDTGFTGTVLMGK